jgi:hypothetical protein
MGSSYLIGYFPQVILRGTVIKLISGGLKGGSDSVSI